MLYEPATNLPEPSETIPTGHDPHPPYEPGSFGKTIRFLVRLTQLILALLAIGLYTPRIVTRDPKTNIIADVGIRSIYADATAGISAIIALVYTIPRVKSHKCWLNDVVLFFMWIALFGIFAKMYLGSNAGDVSNNMSLAMWVDLGAAALWFLTTVWGIHISRKKGEKGTRQEELDA
jgi:hypothetical protein